MARLGSYEEWQRGHPSTPRAVLDEVVGRVAPGGIVRAERIVEGYSNEVYRVRCADEQQVVVRILRYDDGDLAASAAGEAWAIEQVRAVGVPAPEILLLDTIRIDRADFPVMVQRAVPGRPLGEVIDRLSARERDEVLTEVGELVARINAVPVDDASAGRDGRDGRDRRELLAAEVADRHAERDRVLAGGFTASTFDRMLGLLEGYVRELAGEPWVLCHGDLGLKHVFVTEGRGDGGGFGGGGVRVSGVIDFGDWRSGPAVHDLAVLRVREPEVDFAPVLAGYRAAGGRAYRRGLDLHTLSVALGSLAFCVAEGDPAGVERSAGLIRRLLADLDGDSRLSLRRGRG